MTTVAALLMKLIAVLPGPPDMRILEFQIHLPEPVRTFELEVAPGMNTQNRWRVESEITGTQVTLRLVGTRASADALLRSWRAGHLLPYFLMRATADGQTYRLEPESVLKSSSLGTADWSYLDLRGIDLQGADLSGFILNGTDFSYADLRSTDLRNAQADRALFTGAQLEGMNAAYASFTQARFESTQAAATDMSFTVLDDAQFVGARFTGANFTGATGVRVVCEHSRFDFVRFASGAVQFARSLGCFQ